MWKLHKFTKTDLFFLSPSSLSICPALLPSEHIYWLAAFCLKDLMEKYHLPHIFIHLFTFNETQYLRN